MEFLETHTGKDAKAVWKNDIDVPVKEEAIEKSGDESDEDEKDESKENKGKKNEEILSSFFFYFFRLHIKLNNLLYILHIIKQFNFMFEYCLLQ